MNFLQNITNQDTRSLSISDAALKRLLQLLSEEHTEKNVVSRLRIRIEGGGCSGFQYLFSLDTSEQEEDIIFRVSSKPVEIDIEIEIIIDQTSLDLVAGSQLDFVEDLMSAAFVIKNPNATASCGCGNSFSIF